MRKLRQHNADVLGSIESPVAPLPAPALSPDAKAPTSRLVVDLASGRAQLIDEGQCVGIYTVPEGRENEIGAFVAIAEAVGASLVVALGSPAHFAALTLTKGGV